MSWSPQRGIADGVAQAVDAHIESRPLPSGAPPSPVATGHEYMSQYQAAADPGRLCRSYGFGRSAADVGGVGHPVAGGSSLPGDGDVDVKAEHASENGG